MKKSIITTILSIVALTGSVFAHDCGLVIEKNLEEILSNYSINYKEYTWVLPAEAFNQALINLKAYCCAQVVQTACTDKEKENLPTQYPESAYLFDHLIDITMRRLDGITGLAYGLSPDPTALKRREEIDKIANSAIGMQSSEIEKLYREYRQLHNNENFDITNYNKNDFATFSLRDKYNTLCDILKNLYEKLKSKDSDIIIGWYLDKNSFFNGCRNLVNKRVQRENGYVKILMVQKSNQLFNETMKAYTKKHFVEEKLMGLWTLINKVKDMFKTIVQQAPASKTCSK